ncbi:MAG TPA: DUF6438 domain-containing protein [Polyangiales bacterium]
MRNAERAPWRRGLVYAALLSACASEPHATAPREAPAPTHYLNETFPIANALCRLVRVEAALTEPRLRPPGRPPEDIAVVKAELACQPVSPSSLPLTLAWIDDQRREHAPSTRTALSEREPAHHVFEVAPRSSGLSTPRRYDAKSGDPRGLRERGQARLLVSDGEGGHQQVIAPWPRQHDRALDDFLDRLARTLASGAPFDTLSDSEEGHAAIRAAAELYQRAMPFAEQLVVRSLALPRLGLVLERGGGEPLASFWFELSSGEPRVLRAHDLEDTRRAVQCAEDQSSLAARVERASPEQAHCNVLGLLIPGACRDVEETLLRDALRMGTQCELSPALGLDVHAKPAASDFEVRLRRGRGFARLERTPHYRVTLTRGGHVSFEGQARVRALGQHEGRSSPQLVAAIADRFTRMGWFDRQDGQACQASDDRGDQLELRLNGRTRVLRDREGCRGGFSARELELARAAIERASGVSAWLDGESPDTPQAASPRNPEIWMVAAE